MKLILSLFTLLLLCSASYAEENTADGTPEGGSAVSSAEPSMPAIPRTEPNPELNRFLGIMTSHHPDVELVQLTTSKTDEQVIGFFQLGGHGVNHGGVLIIPDETTTPDWPDDLHKLRTMLADTGWYTLALNLPTPIKPSLPKRTLPVLSAIKPKTENETAAEEPGSGDENSDESNTDSEETDTTTAEENSEAATQPEAEETEDSPPPEPYKELATRYITSGISHLQQQGVNRILVMGIGTGSVWAADYVAANQSNTGLRLVMINARSPNTPDAPDLMALLPKIKLPIIDAYHGAVGGISYVEPKDSAERRLKLARRKLMNNFHQSRLPGTAENWKTQHSWMAKHIRGLINTHIIKAEKNKRSIKLNSNRKPAEQAPGGNSQKQATPSI